jgi:hypothetical protein
MGEASMSKREGIVPLGIGGLIKYILKKGPPTLTMKCDSRSISFI